LFKQKSQQVSGGRKDNYLDSGSGRSVQTTKKKKKKLLMKSVALVSQNEIIKLKIWTDGHPKIKYAVVCNMKKKTIAPKSK